MANKPFAITLKPGTSLANLTGTWRTARPCISTASRLQQCLPGRRKHPGLAVSRRVRRLRDGLARVGREQSAARRDGACVLPPLRNGLQSRPIGRGGWHQLGRTFPRRRGDQARLEVRRAAAASGKKVLVVGAGPSGLSAAYHLARMGHQVEIHEAGPLAGGMMRFGIPSTACRAKCLDAEVQRILDLESR